MGTLALQRGQPRRVPLVAVVLLLTYVTHVADRLVWGPASIVPSGSRVQCRHRSQFLHQQRQRLRREASGADKTNLKSDHAAGIEDLEARLLNLCADSNRGQRVSLKIRDQINNLVGELEHQYLQRQPVDTLEAIQGTWELVYSSEPLFLATPFWWCLGKLLRSTAGDDLTTGFFGIVKGLSEGPMSASYGAVLQTIRGNNLTSDVGLGLFNTVEVMLVTEATIANSNVAGETTLALQRTRVLGSPLQGLDDVDIPIATAFKAVAAVTGVAPPSGGAPLPRLQTAYVGPGLRVNRLQGTAGAPESSQISVFQRITGRGGQGMQRAGK